MTLFLQQLERRVLVFDGAMGTAIHALNLSLDADYRGKENCSEILVQTRPDAIQVIHESYLEAGADAVETNTFGANRLVLAEFELADQTFAINKAAAEIAHAACGKYSSADRPRFVVGSLGPGTKLLTLGNTTWPAMFESYREQVSGLLAGGVDALLIETAQDLLQVKCAINACLAALAAAGRTPQQVPIMVQVTIETTGTMLLGTEIAAALVALERYPILSLGMNCATGPQQMTEHLRYLAAHWPRYVSVQPNAGLPQLVRGRTEYPLGPAEFAQSVAQFVVEFGVNIVGGCCGTTPEHIRLLAAARPAPKAPAKVAGSSGCASLYSVVDYDQQTSILNVGERTNASGSRKFKQLLEAEHWDEMISLAREQVREGSHVIDVNVDYAGRDGARDMAELVKRLVRQVNVPLMLDSTSPAVIEAGLQHAPGKCLINSANLEDGEEKFARMCDLARTYNAGLVLGTIDEDPEEAMARTEARKIAIAQRMVKLAVDKYGLAAEDLFIDPLVLPVSTGMAKDRRSALETIAAVRRIAKDLPQCHTIVGLSNVSFGLKAAARQVLNSVFLHELVQAGLTAAIVHVSKILPKSRIPDDQWQAALDLIYDKRPVTKASLRDGTQTDDPLQIFIDLFPDGAHEQVVTASMAELPLQERLQRHIIDGEKRDLTATLDEALRRYDALAIINDHLLAGMKTVGDLFGSGQMQLPFVLQSAEVMKMAVAHLQPHMPKTGGPSKGSIILATVKGDVHDIGKNLVDIILSNNGYTVHNLGIKQPIANILAKLAETKADAIGLSGLLVKSVHVMEENLRELAAQGVDAPVLLGGAALSRHYCEGHLRSIRSGKVYYGQDAFEALRIMDHLKAGTLADLDALIAQRLAKRTEAEKTIVAARQRKVAAAACASVSSSSSGLQPPASRLPPQAPPFPPFWGTRVVSDIDLADVYPYINTVALFRGQWQFKKGRMSDAEYDTQLHEVVQPLFEKLKARCRDEAILVPKVVYGYFPCNSDSNTLIVFDPAVPDRELERFTFPRQTTSNRLCISDFFLPVSDGRRDVVAFTCVTVGPKASQMARQLFEQNRYQHYLYLHGLGVESAEALAEYWHKRVREELDIAGDDSPNIRELFTQHYRGSRYSFGYPACPDMSDQEKLFRLLEPQRIGCTLTENYQIDPEQSTSALIAHHPAAKYFSV